METNIPSGREGQESLDSDMAASRADTLRQAETAQTHAIQRLPSDLRKMVNNPRFSDITFVGKDGKRVQASRLLLAGRSATLRRIIDSEGRDVAEIPLREINSPALLSVFEFLYTGSLVNHPPETWRMACELMVASRLFLLSDLERISHKFMYTQNLALAEDLPKAATLLTEVMELKDLCDMEGIYRRDLVIALSSDWSEPRFVRNLSENAFHYLLENSKGRSEDDDKQFSLKEYLRFRQVILWWVYKSSYGPDAAVEALVNYISPDKEKASKIMAPGYVDNGESPSRDTGHLLDAWFYIQLDDVARRSAMSLFGRIDMRRIHPILLDNVINVKQILT